MISVLPFIVSVVSFHVYRTQSFTSLNHRPLIVDLTIEDKQKLKVIYGSAGGFHVIDLDSATVKDIYRPSPVSLTLLSIIS